MNQIGYIALLVGFVMATYAVIALSVGAWRRYPELIKSGRRAAWSVVGLVLVGVVCVQYALLTSDFSLRYVVEVSSREMEWWYKMGAMWGGQEGSLLLWSLILSVCMAVLLIQTRKMQPRELTPWIIVAMSSGLAFFLAMCTLVVNVFQPMPSIPANGKGLNPLLQNPGMMIHPPMLYTGYVSTIAGFGFAFAALVSGRLDNSWVRLSRRWILTSWVFLTIGNFLGGQWAYVTLGWGGYWAWDPVENAAIMPWFINTALLHSVMIQQRRGIFKVWNLSLAIIGYALSLFGTFLTRSGVLSSVHAFGESTLGPYFMVWIGAILIVGFGLVFMRLPELRGENKLEGLLSRESSFLLNNILFFLAVIFMLWGTISPLVTQIFGGVKSEVKQSYFVQTVGPVLLAVIFLMGIGPLIAWRKASLESITRSFWIPALLGMAGAAFLFAFGVRQYQAVLGFAIAIFTATTVGLDYYKGIRARRRHTEGKIVPAVTTLVKRNRPRYGGLLVHLGIVIITVVILASTIYKVNTITVVGDKTYQIDENSGVTLAPGQTMIIKGFHEYRITLDKIQPIGSPLKMRFQSYMSVLKDGKPDGQLMPAAELYTASQQPNTVVYIRVDPLEDLYLSMPMAGVNASPGPDGKPVIQNAAFQVWVNPLMMWSWVGLAITIIGLLIAIWPEPAPATALAVEKVRPTSKEHEPARA
ncbi:MAG TPA: cytochrome c biogenesis protein CcsA [Chloroflexia bacterium]|nr:cytochrome c biogenesis protein CcsA [Chloroflexia bacterium]